jgi:hypothetical protein
MVHEPTMVAKHAEQTRMPILDKVPRWVGQLYIDSIAIIKSNN